MENFAATLVLILALVLPVVLFLLLRRTRLNGLVSAAIAIAAGWALNIAYFSLAPDTTAVNASQVNADNLAIAVSFGWVCPAVLVFLTWLVWRIATRRRRESSQDGVA